MRKAIRPVSKSGLGPLPLMIGVTGHRDLRGEDREALETRVQDIFTEMRTRYPSTPLVLLSPLAEGADRLVARVALKNGARLIVPLPMPRELYEIDFEAPTSRAEFNALLQQAEGCFALPLHGTAEADICSPGEARNDRYALVGAYIAQHSQILVALWDGASANAVGGTAQIVRFKLEGVPERYVPPDNARHPLDPAESGPVYHIVTPRLNNPQPRGSALSLVKRFPQSYVSDAVAQTTHDRLYARMETFNHDALRYASHLAAAREASKGYVLPRQEVESLSGPLTYLLDCYAVVDTLALYFQQLTQRTLIGLLIMVFCAAISFEISSWLPDQRWIQAVYLGVLLAGFAWYLWAKRRDYQNKSLDYRALAEGLRVQLFWRLAGLKDTVADHYLRRQRGELEWIRQAIRCWNLPAELADEALGAGEAPILADRMRLVFAHWVQDQYAYFVRAARRDHRLVEHLKHWGRGFFMLGLAWPVMKVLLILIHPWLKALGMAPLIAGLLYGYAKTRALSEHAKQYGRMSLLFANAKQGLEELMTAGKYAGAQALIKDLGKEALAENGDWVLLHRERPLEVPKA
jgi:hypothetical protein